MSFTNVRMIKKKRNTTTVQMIVWGPIEVSDIRGKITPTIAVVATPNLFVHIVEKLSNTESMMSANSVVILATVRTIVEKSPTVGRAVRGHFTARIGPIKESAELRKTMENVWFAK